MAFDPRTATQAEFEAEARRLHAERLARIEAMTEEENAACEKFMMEGYMDRARTLRVNELFSAADLEIQINDCVRRYREERAASS